MSTEELVPLVVAVLFVLVVVGVGLAVARHRTRQQDPHVAVLPEPDRPVEPAPTRPEPVQASVPRPEPAPRPMELRPLTEDARQRYLAAWDGVQGRFVDAPVLALSEADALLTRLLADRGFPTDDLRVRTGAMSPRHTHVLEAFHAGHAIEQRNSTQRADAEEVRQGMLHFTDVFEALVGDGGEPYPRTSQKVSQRENG